jgi:hypothetical protein
MVTRQFSAGARIRWTRGGSLQATRLDTVKTARRTSPSKWIQQPISECPRRLESCHRLHPTPDHRPQILWWQPGDPSAPDRGPLDQTSALRSLVYRPLRRNDRQAINICEIAVAGNQGRPKRAPSRPPADRFHPASGRAVGGSQRMVARNLAAGLLQLRAPSTRRKSCDPEQYSPRTIVQATTRSPCSSPAVQFSIRDDALIRSLIAFVSRRYVTSVATFRRRPDRAPAAAQRQSRHPDHRPKERLDEIVAGRLATRILASSLCRRGTADRPALLALRSSAARSQSPRGRVPGHLGI